MAGVTFIQLLSIYHRIPTLRLLIPLARQYYSNASGHSYDGFMPTISAPLIFKSLSLTQSSSRTTSYLLSQYSDLKAFQ